MPPTQSRLLRRALLAVLLLTSLALFTGYQLESSNGPLHRIQRAAGDFASPVTGGLQRVAQPFRDAAGWVRDVAHAKSQRDKLEAENQQLRSRLADKSLNAQDAQELLRELNYVQSKQFKRLGLYTPHGARVVVRSIDQSTQRVLIDQGSNQGIRVGDPVVTGVDAPHLTEGAALVGRVTGVSSDAAEVTLITDPTMAVGAMVAGAGNGSSGTLQPSVGGDGTLVLQYVRKAADVQTNQNVVTSGFSDSNGKIKSWYPRGIPIGLVTYASQSDTQSYKTIQVTPWVDLQGFASVIVLTGGGGG